MKLRPILLSLLTLLPATDAFAIPAFARRYALPCHYCHDGFPKLSPLGEQFRERGFRLEQESAFKVKEWLKTVPVSLRSGVNQTFVEEGDARATGFFKIITAGSAGSRVTYWLDQQFSVTGDGFDYTGTDNAWGRVEIRSKILYARGGRIELDLPFTQARSPHPLIYDIYFYNTGLETDTIGLAQDGGELGGLWGEDVHWSVAVVRGRNSAQAEGLTPSAGRFDGNVYGRIQWRYGQERVGGLAYVGRNVLARSQGGRVVTWTDGLARLGLDGEMWLKRLNLYGLVLYGRNGDSTGNRLAQSWVGGFVQADYHYRDELVPTLRFNWIAQPQGQGTLYGIAPGLELWLHRQVKLSFEVSFYNLGKPVIGAFQFEVGI